MAFRYKVQNKTRIRERELIKSHFTSLTPTEALRGSLFAVEERYCNRRLRLRGILGHALVLEQYIYLDPELKDKHTRCQASMASRRLCGGLTNCAVV